MTPTYLLDKNANNIYIKREDLISFSFGGNKARKAKYFFEQIDSGNYDAIVTYGSGSSNHCRIVANMAKQRNLECIVISPLEENKQTYNSQMVRLFGAKVIVVPVDDVHQTIEDTIAMLKKNNKRVYFIPGGGHGILGTKAYVDCFDEILDFERQINIKFDYIFLATGTGATQAGLVCGKIINSDKVNIIGISIARKNSKGKPVVIESIKEYLDSLSYKYTDEEINNSTIFIDKYTGEGYGKTNNEINNVIKNNLFKYGIPMDETYTGKAYYGMRNYITENNIKDKNILFIHTGGTPLFFDYLKGLR